MKILVAVDGSPISTKAVRHAARLAQQLAAPPEIVLLHADPPLLQSVAVKLGADAVKRYHADNAREATRAARAALKRSGLAFRECMVVAEPAEAIIREAKKARAELIVMGTHGHGAIKALIVGSVAAKVITQADVPVTVVR